jgi:2,4-diketo-3-deoxy-L-fuconate hydrolase
MDDTVSILPITQLYIGPLRRRNLSEADHRPSGLKMRICRFDNNRLGLVRGDKVIDVTPALDLLPPFRWPLPYGDMLMANLDAIVPRAAELAVSAPTVSLSDVTLLSPVANASKIIAAPVNYMKHVEEARADKAINFGADIKTIDHYGLFLKSNTSLIGAGEHVRLPNIDRRMDHEVELAVVIGRECYQVKPENALDVVCGYSIALDMSVRGTEDRSWRKSYDTFSVLGPWLVTADEISDSGNLDLSIAVNGQERQRSNTRALIFNIPKLISYASQAYRLYPGDVIMTGTPEGVGAVVKGDIMTCTIEAIGSMSVHVG